MNSGALGQNRVGANNMLTARVIQIKIAALGGSRFIDPFEGFTQ